MERVWGEHGASIERVSTRESEGEREAAVSQAHYCNYTINNTERYFYLSSDTQNGLPPATDCVVGAVSWSMYRGVAEVARVPVDGHSQLRRDGAGLWLYRATAKSSSACTWPPRPTVRCASCAKKVGQILIEQTRLGVP